LRGVLSMKVFCLPSCPAKQPLAKNVVYFHSYTDAIKEGYRPCKRCQPKRLAACYGSEIRGNPGDVAGNGKHDILITEGIKSPIGDLTVGATAKGICLVEFSDRRSLPSEVAALQRWFGCKPAVGHNQHLNRITDELREYFSGRLKRFTTPLLMPGRPFERAVWAELLKIPYGETATYSQIAEQVGHPGAQRAVGHANGKNRIAIVVPCHRVIQANGALRGYGGGLWRKQYLLELERASCGT
jgi:O-6-methylguanine DNA methyltransferase